MSALSWIDKIYIINLDRSKERLENCIIQAKKFNFTFERFPAIDGSKLTDEQKEYVHPLCKYLLCTNSMIGCGLSHYNILKKIVAEDIQTTLVLEDDFIWRDDTISKINRIKDFDKGIVKLTCTGPFCESDVPTKSDEPQLTSISIGTAAYLIRWKDAKLLLEKINRLMYHIDLQYSFVAKYNSIPIYYYNCLDVDGYNDSTIGVHKSTFFNAYLPIPEKMKWFMNEPFISPFGYGVHLFLIISVILIVIGIFLLRSSLQSKNKFKKWIGILFIIIGLIDILYFAISP